MEYVVPTICAAILVVFSFVWAWHCYTSFRNRGSKAVRDVIKYATRLNKVDRTFIQNYLCQSVVVLHDLFLKPDMNGEFDKAVIPSPTDMVVSIKRTAIDEIYPSVEILDTYVRTSARHIKYEVSIAGRPAITIEWRRASLLGGNYITTSIANVASLKVLESLCYEHLIKPFEEDE